MHNKYKKVNRLILGSVIFVFTMVFTMGSVSGNSENTAKDSVKKEGGLTDEQRYPSLLFDSKTKAEFQQYQSPTFQQFEQLEDALIRWFAEKETDDLLAFYQVLDTNSDIPSHILLSKPELSWGQFAKLSEGKINLFFQATHRFHDRYTGTIINDWWQTGKIPLLFMNTAHRHTNKSKKASSDFSNARLNPVLAASRAFIAFQPEGFIIQIHGFSSSKRKTQTAKQADIILSHGSKVNRNTSRNLTQLKTCLVNQLNAQVLIYPYEVNELGGTKNIVAKELQRIGKSDQFIHIEINTALRKKIAKQQETSERVMNCLLELTS